VHLRMDVFGTAYIKIDYNPILILFISRGLKNRWHKKSRALENPDYIAIEGVKGHKPIFLKSPSGATAYLRHPSQGRRNLKGGERTRLLFAFSLDAQRGSGRGDRHLLQGPTMHPRGGSPAKPRSPAWGSARGASDRAQQWE
jgi:hypothetical protein